MSRNSQTDIILIRHEHTHQGGLMLCDDGADGVEQKLGFFGATPVVQRSSDDQAELTSTATLAQVITLVNEVRTALVELGLIKGS